MKSRKSIRNKPTSQYFPRPHGRGLQHSNPDRVEWGVHVISVPQQSP